MRVISAGDNLELRPLCLGHAEALFVAVERNLERLGQWLPWARPGYSHEELRRFIAEKEAGNFAGAGLAAGIWSAGALCGAIELHRIDPANRSSSIGYWIDAEYEGRGIMTRSCRALIDEGFGSCGLHRIEIRCATGNVRSSAVPKRLGFVEEGVLREAEWLHDRWVDLRVFRMLEQDWRSS
jgi:ribosomal-protein-serine acetyltransferase